VPAKEALQRDQHAVGQPEVPQTRPAAHARRIDPVLRVAGGDGLAPVVGLLVVSIGGDRRDQRGGVRLPHPQLGAPAGQGEGDGVAPAFTVVRSDQVDQPIRLRLAERAGDGLTGRLGDGRRLRPDQRRLPERDEVGAGNGFVDREPHDAARGGGQHADLVEGQVKQLPRRQRNLVQLALGVERVLDAQEADRVVEAEVGGGVALQEHAGEAPERGSVGQGRVEAAETLHRHHDAEPLATGKRQAQGYRTHGVGVFEGADEAAGVGQRPARIVRAVEVDRQRRRPDRAVVTRHARPALHVGVCRHVVEDRSGVPKVRAEAIPGAIVRAERVDRHDVVASVGAAGGGVDVDEGGEVGRTLVMVKWW
jgi:hypothetical protein